MKSLVCLLDCQQISGKQSLYLALRNLLTSSDSEKQVASRSLSAACHPVAQAEQHDFTWFYWDSKRYRDITENKSDICQFSSLA